jgi:hypothetical protein
MFQKYKNSSHLKSLDILINDCISKIKIQLHMNIFLLYNHTYNILIDIHNEYLILVHYFFLKIYNFSYIMIDFNIEIFTNKYSVYNHID